VIFSLVGFFVFYTGLLVADVALMRKYIRLGPDETLGYAVAPPGAREAFAEA
jgi:cytochrome d ubiquinol oxidase subunit I